VSARRPTPGAYGVGDMRSAGGIRGRDERRGACPDCRRRRWLLSAVSGPLEYCARDRDRLLELLALDDARLLEAVGGHRTAELRERYERFPLRGRCGAEEAAARAGDTDGAAQADDTDAPAGADGTRARCSARAHLLESICRHDPLYPRALDSDFAPRMLEVAGGAERLARLTAAPVVAVVGSRAPSDYGVELARSLARGLSACEVTVAAGLGDGIAAAAHAGALEAGAGSVAVLGGGLDVACPPRRRGLYEHVLGAGCGISELPHDCAGRRWGQLASERIVAELALLTVVVEAEASAGDLAPARIALALGRTVAAIPGRVTSPLSRGTHALLLDGARLVRGPRDVLELLYALGAPRTGAGAGAGVQAMTGAHPLAVAGGARREHVNPHAALAPELRRTLAHVGAGRDTPDKLARAGLDGSRLLLALSELELMGLLARGDGARYVPRDPLDY
jgi:DNA processing protein